MERKIIRVERSDPADDVNKVTTIFPDTISPSILNEELGIREYNLAERLFRMTASLSHTIVTDTNGEGVHRLLNIHLSKAQKTPNGSETLRQACKYLCSTMGNVLLKKPVFQIENPSSGIITNRVPYPNLIIALGGAKLMAALVADHIHDCWNIGKQDAGSSIPWVELKKVVNDKNQLMGFRLGDEDQHYGPFLKRNGKNVFAVVFDDAALTTLSLVKVKEFTDPLGINLIGVVVLFNHHGTSWPHVEIPIKVALANLPFEMYNNSNCPVCNPKQEGKKKKEKPFNMKV